MQPVGGKTLADLHQSWQEKSVSQAVRKYTAGKHYNELQIQNNNYGVGGGKISPRSLRKDDSSMISPLRKIYGEDYLHRKGVITATGL